MSATPPNNIHLYCSNQTTNVAIEKNDDDDDDEMK
jgi:hypothetical protein